MRVSVPLVPRWLRWLAVVAVAAAIFYLSVAVVPPEEPVTAATRPALVPLDKWRHFLAYAAFGWSLAYAAEGTDVDVRYVAVAVFAVAAGYGLAIEFVQSTVPYRYFGLGDAYANVIGATAALTWFVARRFVRFVSVPSPDPADGLE